MYHPSKGGVRGGSDQFSWDSVKSDKHRENYLGHSVMAPVGRWQKGKDLSWYAKERKSDYSESALRVKQIAMIREIEDHARLVALGLKPEIKETKSLTKEDIDSVLKRNTEQTIRNTERIDGIGFGSGRISMLPNNNKHNERVVFETCKKNNDLSEESSDEYRSFERRRPCKKLKKEKHRERKHKKKKKRKSNSDTSDSDEPKWKKKKTFNHH